MKSILSTITLSLFLLGMFSSNNLLNAQNIGNKDVGYVFSGPREELKSKKIKEDLIIHAFTQRGVFITENPESPWYNATLFAHGSVLKNLKGDILKEVVFYEASDADGDLSWTVLYYPEPGQPGTFEIIQGIGKWAGIKGGGKTTGLFADRVDDHQMPTYEIAWEIDKLNPPNSDIIPGKDNYKFMDKCLSFHGPHVHISEKELDNGISLEFSSQSGVLMSQLGPETVSPRNGATCFDRGTTVKLNGKTQGDIMLLEDTDADGDVVWLYHIWWYNKGPGIYNFIGGIGKWEGIDGIGVTRGMFKGRSDDHFMLQSELVWNLK